MTFKVAIGGQAGRPQAQGTTLEEDSVVDFTEEAVELICASLEARGGGRAFGKLRQGGRTGVINVFNLIARA